MRLRGRQIPHWAEYAKIAARKGQSFHLAGIEVGHAPRSDFRPHAQLFETRYNVGELGIGTGEY
jgi:hypothetical protein